MNGLFKIEMAKVAKPSRLHSYVQNIKCNAERCIKYGNAQNEKTR